MKLCGITFAAIVLLQTLNVGESCTCVPHHHQRSYCDAQFVAQATVISDRIEDEFAAYYKINIRHVYKGQNAFEGIQQNITRSNHICTNGTDTCVKTRRTSAECGSHLEKGDEYLFVGSLEDEFLTYTLCSPGGNLKYVDSRAIDNIKKGYDCRCSVVSCMDQYCFNDDEHLSDDQKCKVSAYVWSSYGCTCDKVNGQCHWSKPTC